ncbi:hypothetical protein [Pandoraea bronchicola]|nr:hypothetical protein [Pandoraea bronchicola]
MNRWRKLLVLWLLCVTLPLQAVAALRTHCAPGSTASASASAMRAARDNHATAMLAIHQTMMTSGHGEAMPGMHHHDDAAADDVTPHPMALQNTSPDPASSGHAHGHHTRCPACTACVVCTALPPSVVIHLPDAQPSTAIPFLRTSASSAVVAVPERPPKARVA